MRRGETGRLRLVVAMAVCLVAATIPGKSLATQASWVKIDLLPLPGQVHAVFRDVNDMGWAVGLSITTSTVEPGRRPVMWDGHGNPYPLPVPAGYVTAEPWVINNSNVVVGGAIAPDVPFPIQVPVVWRDGAVTVLDPLDLRGLPVAITDTDPPVVVTQQGVIAVVGGPAFELPDANSGSVIAADAEVYGGTVVGHHQSSEFGARAAQWTPAGMELLVPWWPFE